MIGLFFDTETNGIKTWDNPNFKLRVVQIGAILQDVTTGRVVGEINLIVWQGDYQVPEGASRVHGISTELANQVGVPKDLADAAFASFLKRADFIAAHNIQYDIDVVNDDLERSAGLIGTKPQFCTMQGSLYLVKAPLSDRQKAYFTSKGKMPEAPYKVPNLTETYKHFFGVPFEGAHDAMADIRACRDVYQELIKNEWWLPGEANTHQPSDKLKQEMESANNGQK